MSISISWRHLTAGILALSCLSGMVHAAYLFRVNTQNRSFLTPDKTASTAEIFFSPDSSRSLRVLVGHLRIRKGGIRGGKRHRLSYDQWLKQDGRVVRKGTPGLRKKRYRKMPAENTAHPKPGRHGRRLSPSPRQKRGIADVTLAVTRETAPFARQR